MRSLPVRLETLEAWIKTRKDRQESRRRLAPVRVDTPESRQLMREARERKNHDRSGIKNRSH